MPEERDTAGETSRAAVRAAAAAMGLNVLLSLLDLGLAYASGSLAVAAELTHNLVDLAASVAVLIGVHISERQSRAFPYGLYKVENVVAVGVSILIFFTAYEIAREALFAESRPAVVTPIILAGVATADGRIEHQEILANPHLGEEKAKGLRVGEWLAQLKTDVVLLRQVQPQRGPAYLFRDAGVEVRPSAAADLAAAIASQPESASG